MTRNYQTTYSQNSLTYMLLANNQYAAKQLKPILTDNPTRNAVKKELDSFSLALRGKDSPKTRRWNERVEHIVESASKLDMYISGLVETKVISKEYAKQVSDMVVSQIEIYAGKNKHLQTSKQNKHVVDQLNSIKNGFKRNYKTSHTYKSLLLEEALVDSGITSQKKAKVSQKKYETTRAKLEETIQENTSLQAAVTQKTSLLEEKLAELTQVSAKISELEAKNAEYQKITADYVQIIGRKDIEINHVRDLAAKLSSEKAGLTETVSQLQAQNTSLLREKSELKGQVSYVSDQNEALQTKLTEAQSESFHARKKSDEYLLANTSLQNTNETLTKKVKRRNWGMLGTGLLGLATGLALWYVHPKVKTEVVQAPTPAPKVIENNTHTLEKHYVPFIAPESFNFQQNGNGLDSFLNDPLFLNGREPTRLSPQEPEPVQPQNLEVVQPLTTLDSSYQSNDLTKNLVAQLNSASPNLLKTQDVEQVIPKSKWNPFGKTKTVRSTQTSIESLILTRTFSDRESDPTQGEVIESAKGLVNTLHSFGYNPSIAQPTLDDEVAARTLGLTPVEYLQIKNLSEQLAQNGKVQFENENTTFVWGGN